MCPGVDSASKNEYQDTRGGKDGRCVRLTIYHFYSAERHMKIRGLTYRIPKVLFRPLAGKLYLYLYQLH